MPLLHELNNTELIQGCDYMVELEQPITISLEEASHVFNELPTGIAVPYVNMDGVTHKYNKAYVCNDFIILFDNRQSFNNGYTLNLFYDMFTEQITLHFTTFQNLETFVLSNWQLCEIELKPYKSYR